MTEYSNTLNETLDKVGRIRHTLQTPGWNDIKQMCLDMPLETALKKLKKETDYNKILKLQAVIEVIEGFYQQLDSAAQQGNQAEIDLMKYREEI